MPETKTAVKMGLVATIRAKAEAFILKSKRLARRTAQRAKDLSRGIAQKRSDRWDTVRDAHVKANPWCAGCGCRDPKVLNAHHRRPFHLFPELELDPANLITLCETSRRCHLDIGHEGNWKSWNPAVADQSKRMLRLRSQRGEMDAMAVCPTSGRTVHTNGARLAELLEMWQALPSAGPSRANLVKSVLRQDPVLHDALKREVARLEAAAGLPPAARSDTLPPQ